MDRRKELEDYLEEYRKKRGEEKRERLKEQENQMFFAIEGGLKLLIEKHGRKQREEGENRVNYVFLCRLLSSSYTDSGEIVLGMSDSFLYLDERKSLVCWSLPVLYEGIEEDMAQVRKLLQKRFIRLEEFELFYIKKKLLDDNWEQFQDSASFLAGQAAGVLAHSGILLEDEVIFLYGNYMDDMKIAGTLRRKKDGEEADYVPYGR
jgi:hypothetical protein